MNIDLMTADLKKKSSGSQSYWLVGQPDVDLIHIGTEAKGRGSPLSQGEDKGNIKSLSKALIITM